MLGISAVLTNDCNLFVESDRDVHKSPAPSDQHLEQAIPSSSARTPSLSGKPSNGQMSPYDLAPLPQAPPRQTTSRKRTFQSSTILTATPHKLSVKQSQEKKKKTAKSHSNETRQSKTAVKKLSFNNQHTTSRAKKQGPRRSKTVRQQPLMSGNDDDRTPCCVCNKRYNEPPFESWTQCPMCHQWFHDSCGPCDTDTCYFCLA